MSRFLVPFPRHSTRVFSRSASVAAGVAMLLGVCFAAWPQGAVSQPKPTPVRVIDQNGWKVKIYRRPPHVPPPAPTSGLGVGTTLNGQPSLEPLAPTPTMGPTPIPPDPSTVVVAMVDGRRMTLAELQKRVKGPMKKVAALTKVIPGTADYQEALNDQEGILVQDWVNRVLLAEEAKRRGIMLNEKDFEKQYKETIESPEGKQEYENTLKVLGMSPEEVRAEFYDTLLGDKVVDEETPNFANDAYLRERYNRSPELFRRPAQVHVLLYSQTLEGNEDQRELRALRDRMEGIRKRMAKGESPSAIAESEGGKPLGAGGMDLGWVTPDIRSLPIEVQDAVAKLKPGQTSNVILSQDLRGRAKAFHIVKVTEARPATGNTFETAKPLMLENLKSSVRAAVLKTLRKSGKHQIIVNLSGIPKSALEGKPEAQAWSAVRNRPVQESESKAPASNPSIPSSSP